MLGSWQTAESADCWVCAASNLIKMVQRQRCVLAVPPFLCAALPPSTVLLRD